jgi:ribosome-associated protein
MMLSTCSGLRGWRGDFVKISVGGSNATLGGHSSTRLRQDHCVESIQDIQISGPTIRLGQLLKLSGLAQSGGAGKALLLDGVLVNGVAETRRGRQLRDGDIVAARGVATRVLARAPDAAAKGAGGQ